MPFCCGAELLRCDEEDEDGAVGDTAFALEDDDDEEDFVDATGDTASAVVVAAMRVLR